MKYCELNYKYAEKNETVGASVPDSNGLQENSPNRGIGGNTGSGPNRGIEGDTGNVQNKGIGGNTGSDPDSDSKKSFDPVPEEYSLVRQKIFAKLVNPKGKIDLLSGVPHKMILDLALVYYLYRENDPDEEEILVTQEMADVWDADDLQMFRDAMINTRSLLGVTVRPLREMLGEMIRKMDVSFELEEGEGIPMHVMTNHWKRNGAICMLFEDILEECAKMADSDLYLIPSSIHEVILVPVDEGLSRSDLDSVIRSVNRDELSPEDVLSEHSYIYSRKLGHVIF